MPEKMDDERAKDHFANTAALICIAHDVSELVVILESWIKVAAPGEALDLRERPCESLDRRCWCCLCLGRQADPCAAFARSSILYGDHSGTG
jgi:hypothetical protein